MMMRLLLLVLPGVAAKLDPSRTPPMGWRSWNCFLDQIDHDRILGQAKALAASPLLKAGYGRVGIDGGWVCTNAAKRASACTCGGVGGSYHDAAGRPVVGRTRFPNLTALTAASHALSVKLDFYGNSCNCVKEEQAAWKKRGGNPLSDVVALHSYGMDGELLLSFVRSCATATDCPTPSIRRDQGRRLRTGAQHQRMGGRSGGAAGAARAAARELRRQPRQVVAARPGRGQRHGQLRISVVSRVV